MVTTYDVYEWTEIKNNLALDLSHFFLLVEGN